MDDRCSRCGSKLVQHGAAMLLCQQCGLSVITITIHETTTRDNMDDQPKETRPGGRGPVRRVAAVGGVPPPVTPESVWATAAVAALRTVRLGKAATSVDVEGVRLLDRVSYDDKTGVTFYHLSHRAREQLRAAGALAWGRM